MVVKVLSKDLIYGFQNYKPEGYPEVSYEDAKAEWDDRIGNARVQAKNWRFMALGMVVISLYLLFINHDISRKSRITPYVVERGSNGAVVTVAPAARMNYHPGEKEIKYFLGQFINKTRSLSIDPVVAKQNWLDAYKFLNQQGTNKMNQYVKENDPFTNIGKKTTQVQVVVIVPLTKDTYQAQWQEEVFSNMGNLENRYRMTGVFTIMFSEPKTEEEILKNPLGIYIKDFSWVRDVTDNN